MVSLGVSVDRDTVHGVALAEGGDRLPDRVRDRRTAEIGDERGDLTAAIESVLSDLAGAIEDECDISGVAVAYRDAAERRAVVTGLAAGTWHDASLVSVRSAHLALAAASSWMHEFDYVVVCEVGPGLQAFSLIGPERDRVVAAITATASVVNDETIGLAIATAWDQFDVAEARPDAVVVVGTATAAVTAALESGFAAPVIPCALAEVGPAVGAALVALPEVESEAGEPARGSRRGVVLLAAAGVLAGGLGITAAYELGQGAAAPTSPVQVDAHGTADDHKLPEAPQAGAPVQRPSAVAAQSDLSVPEYVPVPPESVPGDISATDTSTGPDGSSWDAGGGTQGTTEDADTPQAVTPNLQTTDAGPDTTPGDSPSDGSPSSSATGHVTTNSDPRTSNHTSNSPAAAADFGAWWENHWPQMVQWALTPNA
ncbi:hypothetical protein EBN03_11610 [Nocardia stercoris]|uniref:DUF7159 domain-containing protein n=1 Tax=Nocardia stercoris TaxID=2483361 RepID=A0A3M2L4P7_9NOCA|nr:hypothetical protein EBN03_11610 [Nocardia stercoris]